MNFPSMSHHGELAESFQGVFVSKFLEKAILGTEANREKFEAVLRKDLTVYMHCRCLAVDGSGKRLRRQEVRGAVMRSGESR
jgi:hypothetical protein